MKASEYKKEFAKDLRKLKRFSKELSKIAQGFLKMAESAKMSKDGK